MNFHVGEKKKNTNTNEKRKGKTKLGLKTVFYEQIQFAKMETEVESYFSS